MGSGGGGGGGMADIFDLFTGGGGGRGRSQRERKSDDVQHKLTVTLEDLYNGTTKCVLVGRSEGFGLGVNRGQGLRWWCSA